MRAAHIARAEMLQTTSITHKWVLDLEFGFGFGLGLGLGQGVARAQAEIATLNMRPQ